MPINVYRDDMAVCQCQTPELAAEIVRACNSMARIAELEAARAEARADTERLRAALEPFAAIWRATTPMLRPHQFGKQEDWYKAAAETIDAARAGEKP
jgi:hypothetical protein